MLFSRPGSAERSNLVPSSSKVGGPALIKLSRHSAVMAVCIEA